MSRNKWLLVVTLCVALSALDSFGQVTSVSRPAQLGVTAHDANSPQARQLGASSHEGVFIAKVFSGYPAARAGLQAGDVVIACDGRRTPTFDALQATLRAAHDGRRHQLTIMRGDRLVTVPFSFGGAGGPVMPPPAAPPLPPPPAPPYAGTAQTATEPYLGLQARSGGHPDALAAGIESPIGAAVLKVTPAGPAAQAGLRRGDLIVQFGDRPIETCEDLEAATLRAAPGSRHRMEFVRGDRRHATHLIVGGRPVQFPPVKIKPAGCAYGLLLPGHWSVTSIADPNQPNRMLADRVSSSEGAYELTFFHGSSAATSDDAALAGFVQSERRKHRGGHASQFRIAGAPAVMVGFYTDGDRRRAAYRISFVASGRQNVIHALGPALAPTDHLPPVLSDVLARIELLAPPGVPGQGIAGDAVKPVEILPPPTSVATAPQPPDTDDALGVTADGSPSDEQAGSTVRQGGFEPRLLPPVLEESTITVGASSDGVVSLANGASLRIPAGALPAGTQVTLRHLKCNVDGMVLYHVIADPSELSRPAELSIPVDSSPDAPAGLVEILHYHDQDDPGRPLTVDWKPGEPLAKVEVKRFSLFLGLLGGAGFLEDRLHAANTDEKLMEVVKKLLATYPPPEPLPVPFYRQNDTPWCWAASLAMQRAGNRSVEENLRAPCKPQTVAAYAGVGQDYEYPIWRLAALNWAEPFASLGGDFQIKRWHFQEYLLQYIIEKLNHRRAVVIQSAVAKHLFVAVGYTDSALIVNDPANVQSPVWVTWPKFFSLLRSTSSSQAIYAPWTIVEDRPVVEKVPPLTINVANGLGACLTSPDVKQGPNSVGWEWYGYEVARYEGVRASAGSQKGNFVYPVGVGQETIFNFQDVQICNRTKENVRCSLRVLLISPDGSKETELVKIPDIVAKGDTEPPKEYHAIGGTTTVRMPQEKDRPLLPLLSPALHGTARYVLCYQLFQDGREIDRVRVPMFLTALRIDEIVCEKPTDPARFRIKGTGLRCAGFAPKSDSAPVPVALIHQAPGGEQKPVTFKLESDSAATFSLPLAQCAGEVYLRAADGLSSNRVRLPKPEDIPAMPTHLSLAYTFWGEGDVTRYEYPPGESEVVAKTAVEELNFSSGMFCSEMPVRFDGKKFSCKAQVANEDRVTIIEGTFDDAFKNILSLTVKHHLAATEVHSESTTYKDKIDYMFTLRSIPGKPGAAHRWSFAAHPITSLPASFPYTLSHEEYSDGKLSRRGSFYVSSFRPSQGNISLAFESK